MSFFEPPLPPPEMMPQPSMPTEGRFVPGVVPMELVLAHNDRAAIVLQAMYVFSDGVELRVITSVREPADNLRDPARMHARMMSVYAARRFGTFGDANFRFGVQLPDGTKLGDRTPPIPLISAFVSQPEPTAGLEFNSSGGSDTRYSYDIFLWPVPGPGRLALACEWREYDIAETITDIDTAPIIDAAGRARPLWPEDAHRPSHHRFMSAPHMALNVQPPVWRTGPIPESASPPRQVEPQPNIPPSSPEVVGEPPNTDAADQIRETIEIVIGNRAPDDLVVARIEDGYQLPELLARRRALQPIDITARVQRISFDNPDRAIVRCQVTIGGQPAANVDAVVLRRAGIWVVSRDTITMMLAGPTAPG